MPEVPDTSRPSMEARVASFTPRSTGLIVAALLAIMAILLFTSVRQESQVFDESNHLFAGFEYWKHADFGRNPEHPPLVKLLATLPLLGMGLKEPAPVPIPYFKGQDFFNGAQFLYSGDADAILMRGRLVVALFSLALGLLIFFAAREMFGPLTAFLALALFAFEPVLLANGALVTTDMPLAFFFFASVYTFYRHLKQPSIPRLLLCAVVAGCALITKQSGILVLPTMALLSLADLFLIAFPIASGNLTPRPALGLRLRQLALAAVTITVISYFMVWAIYCFRFAARPGQLQMIPPFAAYASALAHPWQKGILFFLHHHRLFPEAYLFGWADILLIPGTRATFLFGRIFPSGKWFFFPSVFLIKTTLTLLILLAFVPFTRVRERLRESLFLAIPIAFFLLVAVASMLNLGVRHLLPTYPFAIVLAASAAATLVARSRVARYAIAALLLLTIVSSLHSYPDFLAYSNELAGGPSNTWRVVTDSNADWGQGLKWTRTYLDKNPSQNCWIGYLNPAVDPAYYGIHCTVLVSGMGHLIGFGAAPIPSTINGTVLLSATEAEGLMWGPDNLNPYQSLLSRKPDAEIGNVMLVYRGTFDLPLLAAQSNSTAAIGLLQQQRFPEAVTLAQAAAQQAPDSAEINAVLGQALMASGRVAEGQKAMATALHLAQTNHPDYQKNLIEYLQHGPPGSQ